ncbi:MAG TPA: COX15/CtaA family protein, partial [Methylibium sp.]|nr:COX15/CtaA family protein [Methylibium sp.]
VLLAALAALAWRLVRMPALRRAGLGLAAVALWQLATGLSNVVLGWPLLAAVGHTGGAAALVLLLTRLLVVTTAARQGVASAAAAPARGAAT